MIRRTVLCALLGVAFLTSGCRFARPQPGVQLSSTPAGARVTVDGEFSGFVTPARIDLATDEWHMVAVELDGYASQTRLVGPGSRLIAVDWRQSSVGAIDTFRFPLLLPIESVVPFVLESRNAPQRIHFHLRRGGR
jgi:hypothetical protein